MEDRTYGVEIEVSSIRAERHGFGVLDFICHELDRAGIRADVSYYTAPDQNEGGMWKVLTDASTGGGPEIVSPPLRGYEGLAEIATVCDVLNRCRARVTRACGLHVHHDASDLTAEDVVRLNALYAVHQPVVSAILPPSRRNNNYARPLNSRRNAERPLKERMGFNRRTSKHSTCEWLYSTSQNGRYMALNWAAVEKHGTVEFRQHSGTTNAKKIGYWVLLTQAFVTTAKNRKSEVKELIPSTADGGILELNSRFSKLCRALNGAIKQFGPELRGRQGMMQYYYDRMHHFAAQEAA